MSTGTTIEWTQATWNPTIGCDRVSPGCDRCYAVGVAHRFASSTEAFAGTTERRDGRTDWTGRVNLLGDDRLTEPLRWRKGRRVFVDSMSDLFHDKVPDEHIHQVFAVMELLTKRHARLRAVLNSPQLRVVVEANGGTWPLPNVWVGVSVENQQWADIRIPALLSTPAAVRWISAEPLLGPVDLTRFLRPARCSQCGQAWDAWACGPTHALLAHDPGLRWVVVGGESGPGCRPMHPTWARQLRDQCAASGVPFLFKQWGGWGPVTSLRDWVGGGRWVRPDGTFVDGPVGGVGFPDGGMREDGAQVMQLLSKKRTGHLLDGREHLEYPT